MEPAPAPCGASTAAATAVSSMLTDLFTNLPEAASSSLQSHVASLKPQLPAGMLHADVPAKPEEPRLLGSFAATRDAVWRRVDLPSLPQPYYYNEVSGVSQWTRPEQPKPRPLPRVRLDRQESQWPDEPAQPIPELNPKGPPPRPPRLGAFSKQNMAKPGGRAMPLLSALSSLSGMEKRSEGQASPSTEDPPPEGTDPQDRWKALHNTLTAQASFNEVANAAQTARGGAGLLVGDDAPLTSPRGGLSTSPKGSLSLTGPAAKSPRGGRSMATPAASPRGMPSPRQPGSPSPRHSPRARRMQRKDALSEWDHEDDDMMLFKRGIRKSKGIVFNRELEEKLEELGGDEAAQHELEQRIKTVAAELKERQRNAPDYKPWLEMNSVAAAMPRSARQQQLEERRALKQRLRDEVASRARVQVSEKEAGAEEYSFLPQLYTFDRAKVYGPNYTPSPAASSRARARKLAAEVRRML